MSLQKKVMTAMKDAMKSKDQTALTALRAVKSAILLVQTESGASGELSEEQEMKLLQKQVKQRKDSAAIFVEQGREDLAAPELAEAAVIEQTGASGMKDMGKVMGMVTKQLAGQADGKTISTIVKSKLMS